MEKETGENGGGRSTQDKVRRGGGGAGRNIGEDMQETRAKDMMKPTEENGGTLYGMRA